MRDSFWPSGMVTPFSVGQLGSLPERGESRGRTEAPGKAGKKIEIGAAEASARGQRAGGEW